MRPRELSFEQTIKEVQDTMTVMLEIERQQSRLLREHSERLVKVEEEIAEHRRASAKYLQRTDQNLAEISDKLNGLIGYMDGQKRP